MKENTGENNVEHLFEWNDVLEAVIRAHKDFLKDAHSEKKLKVYQEKWNIAKEAATSTDDLSELNHHVPIDHISDNHSDAKEKIRTKWIELFTKELPEMANDPYQLIHVYMSAPLPEHKEMALQALISSISTEEDARHFHSKEHSGSRICIALEKKFPNMFSKNEQVDPNDDISQEEETFETINEEDEDDDGAD